MSIENFEERLARMESVLAAVAGGDFDHNLKLGKERDALSGLEMGINFLVLDLRSSMEENEKRQAEVLAQTALLEEKLATIENQAAAIRELSTPVMQIWDGILVLPIIGAVDTRRSIEIMETLLTRITETQARCVIIDVTGVEVVDTRTGDYLLKVASAAKLLGSHCVLTGLRPAVAQTLVEIGADLQGINTMRDLSHGLKYCLRLLKDDARVSH